jgi:hypothetical protein
MQRDKVVTGLEPIVADIRDQTLTVPHLGVTLRTILGATVAAGSKVRRWSIVYKGAYIGTIKIQDEASP